jgi:Restriction endonuclease
VRRRLLERLKAMPPDAFESLIGQLLAAIGFADIEVTSYAGDGGVDVRGTLVVGDVIRTRMAVQVKRWKNNIHTPTVQQVRGALGTHEQGLIITTSDFSSGAQTEAERPNAVPVGLMNGEQLVALLVEHDIGVRRTAQTCSNSVMSTWRRIRSHIQISAMKGANGMVRNTASEHERVQDLLHRAHELMCQFKYEEAVLLTRQATTLAPRSVDAWRELGSACGYAGRAKEMERAFEQALRFAVTPDEEVEAWFSRGNAENNSDQWESALRSFERLAELEPEWAVPWLMRGMVLGNMGSFLDRHYHEEALSALDRALALGGLRSIDERVAYSFKHKSLDGLGRRDEAEVCRRKAEELAQAEEAKPGARHEVQ